MSVLHELRFVLPAAALDSRSASGAETLVPSVRGVDPPLPLSVAAICGGCCRLRVHAAKASVKAAVAGDSEVCKVEYRCAAPLLPLRLSVLLRVVAAEGDCSEPNALKLCPETLLRRVVERVELVDTSGSEGGAGLVTVYCCVAIRVAARLLLRLVLFLVLPALERRLQEPARRIAHRLLRRHWQGLLRRLAQAPAEVTEGASADTPRGLAGPPPPTSPVPLAVPAASGVGNDGDGSAAFGGLLGILLEQDAPDAAEHSPRAAAACEPALTKGMPFYKGFLYKLGDGLLNTTWNLRYFLLIGQSLQYYRSPHEAKPRDVVNLAGATVEWVKDQGRPFTFTVSKSGQRTMCLSGNTEQETCEWVERIEAAIKLTPDAVLPANASSGGTMKRTGLLPAAGADVGQSADAEVEALSHACAQALAQAVSGEGYRLEGIQDGLRISSHEFVAAPGTGKSYGGGWAETVLVTLAVLLTSLLLWALGLRRASPSLLPCCSLASLAALLLRWTLVGRDVRPLLCATARLDCSSEEARETLAEPASYSEWWPGHLEGRLLSLTPGKDEICYTRCRLGLLGMAVKLRSRRRWVRAADGVRYLCSVAEVAGEGGGITGFEGFAVVPCEEKPESTCMVVWLCGLDLAPWAPRLVQERLALRRVRALAGLREWLRSPIARHKMIARYSSKDTTMKETPSQSVILLKGFRRAAGGGLIRPHDLERAAVTAQLALELTCQAARGGRSATFAAAPNGVQAPMLATAAAVASASASAASAPLGAAAPAAAVPAPPAPTAPSASGAAPAAGPTAGPPASTPASPTAAPTAAVGDAAPCAMTRSDLAHRYAARWAYASVFLPPAGSTEQAKDRLMLVVAFMVAGLHVAAVSYPRLPWVLWSASAAKHATMLPDDSRVRVEVGELPCCGAGAVRRAPTVASIKTASFELLSRPGRGYRVYGTDEVACQAGLPGSFRFMDRGVTTVEFSLAGQKVRFTMPELCIRASAWAFGLGSVYEWRGSAHFVDEAGGLQCELYFGDAAGLPGADAVTGTVRDAHGFNIGKIHGSWLGPLLCDTEVLWRGPRHQPVPF